MILQRENCKISCTIARFTRPAIRRFADAARPPPRRHFLHAAFCFGHGAHAFWTWGVLISSWGVSLSVMGAFCFGIQGKRLRSTGKVLREYRRIR